MNERYDFIHLRYSIGAASIECSNDEDFGALLSQIDSAIDQAKLAFRTSMQSGSVESYGLWLESICYIWKYTAPLAKLAVKRVVCQEKQQPYHILKLLLHFIAHSPEEVCHTLLGQG